MANIKFMWQALEDTTITASSSSASGYPTANLQDRDPAKKWISGNMDEDQTLTFQFASALTVNSVIIENHNILSTNGNPVNLRYSSNGSTYTTLSTFTLNNTIQHLEVTSTSAIYWQIQWIKAGTGTDLSAAPQIGNIFLGTRVEMTQPYDTGIEKSSGFSTSQTRAIDGTRYTSQLYNGLKKYKIKFTNINETDKTSINTLFEGIRGSYFPFYFVDADSTIVLVYSVNDENPIQTKAYQIYDSAEVNLEAYSVNI